MCFSWACAFVASENVLKKVVYACKENSGYPKECHNEKMRLLFCRSSYESIVFVSQFDCRRLHHVSFAQ